MNPSGCLDGALHQPGNDDMVFKERDFCVYSVLILWRQSKRNSATDLRPIILGNFETYLEIRPRPLCVAEGPQDPYQSAGGQRRT